MLLIRALSLNLLIYVVNTPLLWLNKIGYNYSFQDNCYTSFLLLSG